MIRSRRLLPILLLASAPLTAQEPNFGRALALDGDDLLIGQPVNWYGPGTVYAYRAGAGGWVEAARVAAPDAARMDDFGRALSLDGDRLAVGAPRKRDGEGTVYLFERGAGEWAHATSIVPGAEADHRLFGLALDLAGDELLIGSPQVDGSGAVYRYSRTGTEWVADETLTPGDPAAAGFGASMSRDGDRLLIGAPASGEGTGGAFVATREETGWSTPVALEVPEGLGERAGFGSSVLWMGDHAVVGAPGAAVVVLYAENEAGDWLVDRVVRPFDVGDGSQFGFSLAAADGELWVGAPGAARRDGRVYRYLSDGMGGWHTAVRVDPDETTGDSWPFAFGYSVAADSDRAVIGMPSRDFGEGRALAIARDGATWAATGLLEGEIFRLGQGLASGDRCESGAMSEFPCENMELVAHLPVSALGGERGVWVNDVWGWEHAESGRRFALVARRDGAAFLEVTDAAAPRLVGNLPRTSGSRPSVWRDIKVIGDHAFIVADGAGAHGMQVFDLTRLLDVGAEVVEFEPETTYREIFSAHNVVADTATGYVYVVGSNSGGTTCGGGLHIVDVRNPLEPTFAGCYRDATSTRGYTHDAQCVVYSGPDEDWRGKEICLGSNESELNIADVTDKSNPMTIARASYPNAAYAHQGWLDEEQRYFYMNDEGDETAGVVARTRTMVWDLTDLDDPILVKEYFGPVAASDHNLFVVGDRMYQSNYGSGLRVLDISDRANPREIAHFDSAPYNDDEPGFSATQSGAWSNYPFFEDGLVIFTSVREGLFIMRVRRPIT